MTTMVYAPTMNSLAMSASVLTVYHCMHIITSPGNTDTASYDALCADNILQATFNESYGSPIYAFEEPKELSRMVQFYQNEEVILENDVGERNDQDLDLCENPDILLQLSQQYGCVAE